MDIPYAQAMTAPERRTARWKMKRPWPHQGRFTTITTGDVAEILEALYGNARHFYDIHGQEIADEVGEVMQGKLESLLMGGPLPSGDSLFEHGELSNIEEMFREMLDKRELDGVADGVPTRAAQRGVNHRLRHPYLRSNPARPSFIDTGLYSANFRVWSD